MKPLRDLIWLKLDKVEERTASGLYMKKDWETAQATGEVLAVGNEVTVCKKGDRIHVNPYAILEAGEHKLIREKDVLAHV